MAARNLAALAMCERFGKASSDTLKESRAYGQYIHLVIFMASLMLTMQMAKTRNRSVDIYFLLGGATVSWGSKDRRWQPCQPKEQNIQHPRKEAAIFSVSGNFCKKSWDVITMGLMATSRSK